MEQPTEADNLNIRGAIDFANMVQARQAENLMGKLARKRDGRPIDPAFRARLLQAAIEGGFEEGDAAAFFERPVLEKLSEYDEPQARYASATLADMLTKTMQIAGMETGGREIMISSLASGQVNALVAANTWDETRYHIFIDSDLMVFCNVLGKLIAECLTRDNVEHGEINLAVGQIELNACSEEIQERAADLFCSTVLRGTPQASKPWLPSASAYQFAQPLTLALNLFPIAHELGHLHLGHQNSEETQKIAVANLGDFDAAVYSQSDEFQADMVGSIVTVQTLLRTEQTNIFPCLAPYIFLKGIELLDACFEVFGQQTGDMSFTHPSATVRARKMRDVIAMHLNYHNSFRLYPQAVRVVDRVFHWFLVAAITNLQRLKNEGHAPRDRIRLLDAEHEQAIRDRWEAAKRG